LIILNAVRGLCMALADSVPGVSGGTVAFLLGFYDRFISSIDDLLRGHGRTRMNALYFLLQLGVGWVVGMGAAIVVLTEVFESHIYSVSSLFLGFILLAIPLVLWEERKTLSHRWKWFFFLLLGLAFVLAVSSLSAPAGGVEVQGFTALLYIFVGGIVAVSAMVLPGISGSTLLLILGLYLPVITAVRSLMELDFSALPTVVAFGLGVCTGVVLVIRLVRYLMERYRAQMIFLIIGLMLGSLYSVAIGPTTLDDPLPALSPATFEPLFFLIGGAVIVVLQLLKIIMDRKK
jgi:putative membrane protein